LFGAEGVSRPWPCAATIQKFVAAARTHSPTTPRRAVVFVITFKLRPAVAHRRVIATNPRQSSKMLEPIGSNLRDVDRFPRLPSNLKGLGSILGRITSGGNAGSRTA
jgi:hypothetical protein